MMLFLISVEFSTFTGHFRRQHWISDVTEGKFYRLRLEKENTAVLSSCVVCFVCIVCRFKYSVGLFLVQTIHALCLPRCPVVWYRGGELVNCIDLTVEEILVRSTLSTHALRSSFKLIQDFSWDKVNKQNLIHLSWLVLHWIKGIRLHRNQPKRSNHYPLQQTVEC